MVLALPLSLLIGLVLGLFGGGGSILTVPALTYAANMAPKEAIATSLLVVGMTSLAALVPHAKNVRWRTGLVFGGTGMLGAYAGGRLARFVPGSWLLVLFAAVMVVTALAMLRTDVRVLARAGLRVPDASPRRVVKAASHGLAVGLITGLVGAGGGFLIVPALVLLGGMTMREAVATSLLVIAMKSLAGFAGYADHVSVDPSVLTPVVVLAVVGSVAGSALGRKLPQRLLRRGFGWFVLATAALMVARELPLSMRTSAPFQAVFVERWPWWVGGAALAAIVFGLLFLENKQLGVSTGCSELCALGRDPAARRSWRPRFLLGIVLGGALGGLLAGRTPTLAMGGLDAVVGGSEVTKLALLAGAGILIGFGTRLAGGCTSGHGIVGTALGARSSWVATVSFMVAGFVTTNLVFMLSGG